MAKKSARKARGKGRSRRKAVFEPISKIRVQGFKATRDGLSIEIRPLTILAGQNSAGKSTVAQPLLLMKQTLEAVHNPGALEMNGPCVKFNEAAQLLWHGRTREDCASHWDVEITHGDQSLMIRYSPRAKGGYGIELTRRTVDGRSFDLRTGMKQPELMKFWNSTPESVRSSIPIPEGYQLVLNAIEDRCAHRLEAFLEQEDSDFSLPIGVVQPLPIQTLESIIHLPGLRGHPERQYPVTRASGRYPGTFQAYTASILLGWSEDKDERLNQIGEDLSRLGLTWKVAPQPLHDTHVMLRIGRLPRPQQGGARDLVNIADVGFGASQVLPVVVALRAARPGQLVHIEQPELHLHPNAQVAMADLLLGAAKRGVRVLAETHSSVLLKRVQVAVAQRDNGVDPSLVAMHWFTRDDQGVSRVSTAMLGEDGSYGDWPVDFADVEMRVEQEFIDAAIARMEG